MNWEEKLQRFLDNWEYKNDLIGILVCGSFIMGNPNNHSDLDVHLILDEKCDYRVRGNKIVDGLLIEYFANTPNQIRKYFEEDYSEINPMSQTQFITGKILLDKYGEVKKLKDDATNMLSKKYVDIDSELSELSKYALWDMLDDLQGIYEDDREDFYFIFYNNLDKLLKHYMKLIKVPYNKKAILGHIVDPITRNKYLLNELEDKEISACIKECITSRDKKEMLDNYEKITDKVFQLSNGFEIDGFVFKSSKCIE
ncbi:MAG: hypothetical protein PHW90_01590 [Bacilli bacterium]|nr:hypothetical protein [Bacilli bacterium]